MRNPIKYFFQRKPKPLLIDNMRIVPAFELKGETYYMHEDPLNTCIGRGLTAMDFVEQVLMRTTTSYLEMHTQAIDAAMNGGKSVNVGRIAVLNNQLKERIKLSIALPEHVYKLATIVYFTAAESPFKYDHAAGKRKVEEWMAVPEMYDFFLQKGLRTLFPYLMLPESASPSYLSTVSKISQQHLKYLAEAIGKPTPTIDI